MISATELRSLIADQSQQISIICLSRKRKVKTDRKKKTSKKTYRFRHWVFTLNNPTEDETTELNGLVTAEDSRTRYLVYQLEKCPTTGTPHFQGYIEFLERMSTCKLKNCAAFERAHLEARKGNRDQARAYAKKEETRLEGPWEFGTWIKNTGNRACLNLMIESAQAGVPLEEALDSDFRIPLARYHKFYTLVLQMTLKKRSRDYYLNHDTIQRQVIALIGGIGTGKTRHVYDAHPLDSIYKWTGGSGSYRSVFFNNYNGEPIILLDDFGQGQLPYRLMLTLTDRYPVRVDTKGGYTYLPWTTIYISSNLEPDRWYPNRTDVDALLRRITKRINFLDFWEKK